MIDIEEIRKYLPHRYPFLLVDRVIEIELNKYIKAYKNITNNEPYFIGHFPETVSYTHLTLPTICSV